MLSIPHQQADGVTQVAFIYDCQSRRAGLDTYWLVPLFGYKLILQFIATVLALLLCTVQVEIKTLDDSRYTQAITYVNMVVLALAVALAFAVNNFENAKAAVNGMIVLVAATFNLSMVFIPYVRKAMLLCMDSQRHFGHFLSLSNNIIYTVCMPSLHAIHNNHTYIKVSHAAIKIDLLHNLEKGQLSISS